jgi:Zn finger protein HypA/HybF involved in hydrogenase expression
MGYARALIAMSIIEGVNEELPRRERIHAVHLRVSSWACLSMDSLLLAYRTACYGARLEDSQLII